MDDHVHHTNIELDHRYRDTDTQFEGVATAITFYRHRSPRVCLTALVSHVPNDQWFDANTLARVKPPGAGFMARAVGVSNGAL